MSRVIEEHRLYLSDAPRLAAYDRALAEVVHPGDVVVDLGAGTGILGLLAARHGAARVYAIEQEGIADLARQIARANGLDRVITSVRGNARAVQLPERADVVVCDQIGGFGVEAGILELATEARARFLKPGGVLVPGALDLVLAAIEHDGVHDRVRFWQSRPAGFDCQPAAEIAANTEYAEHLEARHLLTAAATAATLDLFVDHTSPLQLEASLRSTRAGEVHGIAGWFVARLSPNVTMTNSPQSDDRIARLPLVFPLRQAVRVREGTSIGISMRILPAEATSAWEVRVGDAPDRLATYRHSTLRGMLIGREDLVRTDPLHRPALTAAGSARRTILRLCDGGHTVAEIERAVYDSHREAFSSPAEAAMLVAEVVRRFGR